MNEIIAKIVKEIEAKYPDSFVNWEQETLMVCLSTYESIEKFFVDNIRPLSLDEYYQFLKDHLPESTIVRMFNRELFMIINERLVDYFEKEIERK
jgi:6-pyruvoyl-tetrahydropterin synthase